MLFSDNYKADGSIGIELRITSSVFVWPYSSFITFNIQHDGI